LAGGVLLLDVQGVQGNGARTRVNNKMMLRQSVGDGVLLGRNLIIMFLFTCAHRRIGERTASGNVPLCRDVATLPEAIRGLCISAKSFWARIMHNDTA